MTVYPNGSTSAKPTVSSPYGPRQGGAFGFHYGTDFVGYSNLKAILGGTVTHAGWMNDAAGNAIVIDSRDPLTGRTVTICRFHVASWSVKKGQTVSEGAQIGVMGATGNATGKCDHVEMRYWSGGSYTTEDPEKWLAARVQSALRPDQRRVVSTASANGRAEPTTASAIQQTLPPSTVADFDGWKNGQVVEGNAVWFRGAHSGDWFWSGGFEGGSNTAGLTNLNTPDPGPVAPNQRVVGANPANGRPDPSTKNPVTQSLDPGTVGTFDGWTNGERVEGNDVWFRGAFSGDWFWSGGFTSQATTGLPRIDANPPTPTDPDNPRDLPEYEPVYPRAFKGLKAPLGFNNNGSPAMRTTKGDPPVAVSPIIDRFIIHHTGTAADQLDYFSYRNDRSSCPTFYLRTNGEVFELIRPMQKPASTGPEWNYRSIAVETLNLGGAPDWPVADVQVEELAQMIAWLAEFDGKELDGVPVSFKIDRTHVISHQEVLPTVCPGPYLQSRLDKIVARAQAIYAENHPEPEPDMVQVPRDVLLDWMNRADQLALDMMPYVEA